MRNQKQNIQKGAKSGKAKIAVSIAAGIAIIIIAAVFIIKGNSGGDVKTASNNTDLIIPKSEITQTAKFFPYNAGGTRMEVLAVKASDGSIRTAFNTCQVCNGSARAYYKQEGDALVCQNCGNQFKMDMIEQQRGGCNPVPIMSTDKTDDGANIVISKDYIASNQGIFTDNWKTQ